MINRMGYKTVAGASQVNTTKHYIHKTPTPTSSPRHTDNTKNEYSKSNNDSCDGKKRSSADSEMQPQNVVKVRVK